LVELFAQSALGAYGTLQVGALNFDVTGGAGGAGGAGGGLAGANGLDGTILIFGDLPTAVPVDASVPVVSGLNSLFNTAPSTEEFEKRSRESKEKKAAVCK